MHNIDRQHDSGRRQNAVALSFLVNFSSALKFRYLIDYTFSDCVLYCKYNVIKLYLYIYFLYMNTNHSNTILVYSTPTASVSQWASMFANS